MSTETLESVISTQCPNCGPAGVEAADCERCRSVSSKPLALSPRIDRWTAATALQRALRPLWLRMPGAGQCVEPKALRAVLVPAWALDVDVSSRWTAGDSRSGTRRYTARGLVVPATGGTSRRLVARVLADGADGAVEADPGELSDWQPLPVTRGRSEAWEAACSHLSESAAEEAALGLSLDETESLLVDTSFENAVQRPILVPAWRAVGADFELLVDAHGGRVVGQAPWHPLRLAGLAAVGGLALGLLAALSF